MLAINFYAPKQSNAPFSSTYDDKTKFQTGIFVCLSGFEYSYVELIKSAEK